MSIFSSLGTTGFEEQKDTLGGYQPLDTGAYPAKIKTIYITTSEKGAMAANVVAEINGQEYHEQLWITNSKGENFFLNKKTGNKVALPGFTALNDICLCAIGKELKELDAEPRVFKIYDYNAKAEVPREVPTITELMNHEVILGIVRQRVDKKIKNDAGEYVASGETREENVIEKVFHLSTHKTVNEAKAGAEEAQFYDKWVEKNAGVIRDKAKGKAEAGTAGAPQKPSVKKLFN